MKTKTSLILLLSLWSWAQDLAPSKRDLETGNLTDQQKVLMENAVHSGYQQREYDEKLKETCAENGYSETQCKSIAAGGNATSQGKFMGMSPSMVRGLAQAYSMILGSASTKLVANEGGLSNACKYANACSDSGEATKKVQADRDATTDEAKKAEAQTKVDQDAKKNDAEKKEQEDYCRYIPMGTEAIALVQQKSESEFIINSPTTQVENVQAEMLQKQSRSHASRARSVKTQSTGWGATTACYVAMMAGPASVSAPSNLLKLGGSTLIWRYYEWEKKEHEKAKNTVDTLISKLSGKGVCNPVSERDCYCSQPETQNDVNYCLPEIRKRVAGNNDYQLTCLTEDLKQDLTCSCVHSDTCLDKTIKHNLEGIHIPQPAAMALTPFFQMTKGSMKPGQSVHDVDANSGKLFALANNMLKENLSQVELPSKNLNDEEKDAVKELSQFGLPNELAKALLSEKPTEEAKKNAAKFSGSGRYNFFKPTASTAYQAKPSMNFKGGDGINNKKSSKSSDDYSSILNKFKKKNASSGGNDGNVIRFAEAASKSAQITRDKDRMLFDIISRRYQVSARKRLDITE